LYPTYALKENLQKIQNNSIKVKQIHGPVMVSTIKML